MRTVRRRVLLHGQQRRRPVQQSLLSRERKDEGVPGRLQTHKPPLDHVQQQCSKHALLSPSTLLTTQAACHGMSQGRPCAHQPDQIMLACNEPCSYPGSAGNSSQERALQPCCNILAALPLQDVGHSCCALQQPLPCR